MKKVANSAKSSKRPRHHHGKVTAPFALTSDGELLINASECEGRSLEGRAIFTGVAVSRSEARFTLQRVDDSVADTASKIAASMPVVPNQPAPQSRPVSKNKAAIKAEHPARAQRERSRAKPGGKGA
jgi:hypothetical protein